MPSCRVTNNTPQPLNVCLKQVTALHFENGVQSGQTIKLKPGKVWFTLEARVDDGTKKSRYSVLKSAATIALLSIAVGAVAATAGAAMMPASVAAGGTAAGAYLAKGMTVTKGALIKNSGTIAKISSVALPKAIEKMSSELGGLSALQREVMSIIASPTLSSDVRHKSTNLLKQLYEAYNSDKTKPKDSTKDGGKNGLAATAAAQAASDPAAPPPPASLPSHTQTQTDESVPAFSPPDPRDVAPGTQAEAQILENELELNHLEDKVENTPISTDETLRVHGIYMNKRRHFEVRVDQAGKLVLWDMDEEKMWGT